LTLTFENNTDEARAQRLCSRATQIN